MIAIERTASYRWVLLLGMIVLTSCHPGPTIPPQSDEFPRCLAADRDGNEIVCAAPARTYEGDRCTCVDSLGLLFVGRVQEYPRQ